MRKLTRREFNKLLTIGIIMPSSLLITPHFSVAEMQCRCHDPNCERKHSPDLDADFMKMLEELRVATFALRISSGARCLAHDTEVSPKKKKTSKGGVHVQGIAADILVGHLPTSEVLRLTKTATEIGFSGYGFALANKNRAKRFIHIDSRSGGAIWSY